MDAQYAANVCTVLAPGMDYIFRHGAAYVQVPSPVGSKRNRDDWQQVGGGAKQRYGKARHQVEALQGGVSGNFGQLPRQGISVVETRQKNNSWAEIYEENWKRVPTKPEEKVQVQK